jgi:cytoskeletal protein CcmA (bactofilin family)
LLIIGFEVASSRRITIATNSEGEVLDIQLDNAQDANIEKYIDLEKFFVSGEIRSQ